MFALGALATITKVCADEGSGYFDRAGEPDTKLTKFHHEYFIDEYPHYNQETIAQLTYGETITLTHTITNEEDSDITVVGLGGLFRNSRTGEPMVNLTANSVGPVVIPPGETASVGQKINLDLNVGDYVLSPQVYVAFDNELKGITGRGQMTVIHEVPISIFNPKLLFLELIFAAIVGGVGYYAYSTSLQSYFKDTAPVKQKVTVTGNSSGYDPSWVPSHHQTLQKKTKSRKSY